jgi:hypothetical protein
VQSLYIFILLVKIAWAVPMEIAAVSLSIIHHESLCHLALYVPPGNYSEIKIAFIFKIFNIFPESSSSIS